MTSNMQQAINEIEKESELAYDVAANFGQIFDNVKHMRWFKEAVACELKNKKRIYSEYIKRNMVWE